MRTNRHKIINDRIETLILRRREIALEIERLSKLLIDHTAVSEPLYSLSVDEVIERELTIVTNEISCLRKVG